MGFDEVGEKQADFTRDGIIMLDDLIVFLRAWLSGPADEGWYLLCDLNDDGQIELADWSQFSNDWQWQADWYGQ